MRRPGRVGKRALVRVPSALVVAALPVVLLGNALLVLINPWIVHAVYALPGFPGDDIGLSNGARKDLAITGVESIRPVGDGVDPLREARLPNGTRAFGGDEVRHMDDVRVLIRWFLAAWAAAVVVAAGSIAALRRLGLPAVRVPRSRVAGAVPRTLVGGAYLTIAVMGLVGLVMAVNFEFFFDGFHEIFFEGDSWRFDDEDTLRQLYPDYFWGVAGATIAVLIALQAAVLAGVLWWRERRSRRRSDNANRPHTDRGEGVEAVRSP